MLTDKKLRVLCTGCSRPHPTLKGDKGRRIKEFRALLELYRRRPVEKNPLSRGPDLSSPPIPALGVNWGELPHLSLAVAATIIASPGQPRWAQWLDRCYELAAFGAAGAGLDTGKYSHVYPMKVTCCGGRSSPVCLLITQGSTQAPSIKVCGCLVCPRLAYQMDVPWPPVHTGRWKAAKNPQWYQL
ncbi:hypothetical protein EWB00_000237 [Schistosoma japonicum]|uniref:Uncharacterized protein n=1 Tax=Schistosoma japonicum TaxID=6182 RepID=A0A4Z2CKJ9_SCHJA|nr:hypothetical protein EWB00_000237 [Schistosoma japonicum]